MDAIWKSDYLIFAESHKEMTLHDIGHLFMQMHNMSDRELTIMQKEGLVFVDENRCR